MFPLLIFFEICLVIIRDPNFQFKKGVYFLKNVDL